MSAFDELQDASFDGIAFPIDDCEVIGGLRDHVHEFPHSPGGAPEKMGRKLYTVRMTANMQNVFERWGPDLWPQKLADLIAKFERELTRDLVIPTIGTISAYAVNWTRRMNMKMRSGEKCTFEFREDSPDTFLTIELVKVSASGLAAKSQAFTAAAEELPSTPLVDGVLDLASDLVAIADQVELYNNVIQQKALALAAACDAVSQAHKDIKQPVHWQTLYALHDLWLAAVRLAEDVKKTSRPLVPFEVPRTMAVSDVSRAIYGDNSHAVEILQLNPIEDAFRILAGTKLRVYAAAA